MSILEVYHTMLAILVAGAFMSFTAAVLFAIMLFLESIRCKLHDIDFEPSFDKLEKFYIEGFLPTMLLLVITLFFLKYLFGTGE